MRHDAQLNLRIIRGYNAAARRGDEGFADAAAFCSAYRNVLQIRIAGGQPARDRHRLRIAGVYAAGRGIHHQRQLVGVGGLELGHAAIFQQQFRQRVIQRQFLQHFFVGRGRAARRFFLHRQTEFVEQDFLYLLGRVEVERLPGCLVGTRFDGQQFLAQLAALHIEQTDVQQHTVALHDIQHLPRWQFDSAVHLIQSACQLRAKRLVQLQGDVGIFRRVARGGCQVHLIKANLLGALAHHFGITDGLDSQVALREIIHVVRLVAFQHVGLQQGVFGNACQRDAVIGEDVLVKF